MATFKDTQILLLEDGSCSENHDHDLISSVVELKKKKKPKKKKTTTTKNPNQTTNQTANKAPANFLFLIRVLKDT